jgi:enediyne biosynthesis protein E4
MAEIQEEIQAGHHSAATQKLIAFLSERPDSDEASYLLGTCQKARGRDPAAAEAWARVPPGSPFAARAIQARMDLEVEAGRLADAERLVKQAMDDPRFDASSLSLYLGPIYWLEGRIAEAMRSIEARWSVLNERGEGASEKAIFLLRLHIELRRNPRSVEEVRAFLDRSGLSASQDDRVWLGKANLAIRTGANDEAERWLNDCLRARPEDVPVWRARLSWALATNRGAAVEEALKHLPVEASTPADVPRLAAWLAARRGDRAAEQRMLERLLAADPADLAAIDRLAELAVEQGHADRANELRQGKAGLDPIQARYQKLHQRNQPFRDAVEMTRLADRLGHRFEARLFATLAVAAEPDRDDLRRELVRLNQLDRAIHGAGRTLFDAVAEMLGG